MQLTDVAEKVMAHAKSGRRAFSKDLDQPAYIIETVWLGEAPVTVRNDLGSGIYVPYLSAKTVSRKMLQKGKEKGIIPLSQTGDTPKESTAQRLNSSKSQGAESFRCRVY